MRKNLLLLGGVLVIGISVFFLKPKWQQTPASNTNTTASISETQSLPLYKESASSQEDDKKPKLIAKAYDQLVKKAEAMQEEEDNKIPKRTRIEEYLKDELRRTKDPALGYIPYDRMQKAYQFAFDRQKEYYASASINRGKSLAGAKWKARGPNNVGGRVGCILEDRNDPTGKALFVGHCSGGLWKTDDITADRPIWRPINDYLQNLAIGGIVQDPKNPKIMYLGTGDPSADDVRGIGMFKSTDGGENWTYLSKTNITAFRKTREIVITNNGYIYAATSNGVYRSTDEGINWTAVLSNNIWDLEYVPSKELLYASKGNSIWRSSTGNNGDWKNITSTGSGFPNNFQRTEFSICESNPDVIYALGGLGGPSSDVYKSTNGGDTWTALSSSPNFTGTQAWYDLDIKVDPFNPNRVVGGGLDLYFSINGGLSWKKISSWTEGQSEQYVHADQHAIHYDNRFNGRCYYGNDGGIWMSDDADTAPVPTILDKNLDFVTTLFYYGAIHPGFLSNFFLAGAQDNGSNRFNGVNPSPATEVVGGDGFWVHIDQDEPNIQFCTLYGGIFFLSDNGGQSFGGGINTNGAFRSFGEYDDVNNILYAQSDVANFYRWNLKTKKIDTINISGASVGQGNLISMAIDPNNREVLYLGDDNGNIVRVDNAQQAGRTVVGVNLSNPSIIAGGTPAISSIHIQEGNSNHIILALSNFGLKNNIVESFDRGKTWVGVEGLNQLPDVPVRWAIFSPNDSSQAMIATDLGVWTTDKLDGTNTVWTPPVPGKGIPFVRTNHLEYRKSDKMVMAATWGRGLWTSAVFADPYVELANPTVGYINGDIRFLNNSLGADSFEWAFGDGNKSNEEAPVHRYDKVGTYDVSLTINQNLTKSNQVKILPDMSTPYKAGTPSYGGDFEGNTEQVGTYTISGTPFERGKSVYGGKNNANSGQNAYVLGINQEYYAPNTHSMIYFPNFNLGQKGIYEFSFVGKFDTQNGYDGFNFEYSTDRGKTWQVLGSPSSTWYNYTVDNDFAAFPKGTPFFTGEKLKYAKYTLNISEYSGPGYENFAIRLVFKSDASGFHAGVAIDDVEINSYSGDLVTRVIEQNAVFTDATTIKVEWATLPEYYCKRFEVEYSYDGKTFTSNNNTTKIATGYLTANRQNYYINLVEGKALVFVRIKVFNLSSDGKYSNTFYTPMMVVRRNIEGTDVFSLGPNPFQDKVNLIFNNLISGPVEYKLFDEVGRLIFSEIHTIENQVFDAIDVRALPKGTYFLSVKIADQESKTYKLVNAKE